MIKDIKIYEKGLEIIAFVILDLIVRCHIDGFFFILVKRRLITIEIISVINIYI